MKEKYSGLDSVRPSRFHFLGPRDGALQWLGTLSDMAQDTSQWRSCCNFFYFIKARITYRILFGCPFPN